MVLHPVLIHLSIVNPEKLKLSFSQIMQVDPFFMKITKLTEYIIRCWTFNVRCSFFSQPKDELSPHPAALV